LIKNSCDYGMRNGYKGDGKPPRMSRQLIFDLAKRYISVYEKITGKKFKVYKYPIERNIIDSIDTILI